LTACATTQGRSHFFPRVGMTEDQVREHWGSGRCSYLYTNNARIKTCRYCWFFGLVMDGFCEGALGLSYAVTFIDGKVTHVFSQ
jgi:hypothetical protein